MTETTAAWLERYVAVLAPAADPLRAPQMVAYMRGHFAYLGVATPQRRILTKPLEKEARQALAEAALLDLADALWAQPEREYQYAACDLLAACAKALTPVALPRLLALVVTKSWWDSVDTLAGRIIGGLVLRHPELIPQIDQLVLAENLWLRRTAIIYQLHWKASTDVSRLFHACLANAADTDFFIRKAIGWGLREHAWTDPDIIRAFVQQHAERLSPLSIREASKHL
ncbi:DNA alkylation repair protein [Silvimonas soli]|uniref:DNA alkylation repair protein n=1 Tax=Silvimonas soli TaxID=2980100 RepID=UPI0024B3356E|nr:DNA alkylation repair protein [Silvimonas soli]